LGTDFAGEVAVVADDVKTFSKGDGVFGFIDTGAESQANYTKVKADQLFLIPENVGFKEAAASLEGAHYAYSFVHKVQIKTGQKVLINGATGGIGSALLQFVRQYDVHITVTCNDKNRELMKSLGADQLIDFNQQDFTELDETYDYVFDAVGKSTYGKSKKVLTSDGTYISSELGPYAQNVFYAMFSFLFRRKVIFPIPFSTKQTIPFISKTLANNTFKPVIEKEYDITEISAAYQYVISGQKTGNVLITYN
jgi:NADPH:quinone reductase-like Zn-dependent oxidoreductase